MFYGTNIGYIFRLYKYILQFFLIFFFAFRYPNAKEADIRLNISLSTYPEWDLNPHSRNGQGILSPSCLPIPPSGPLIASQ